MDVELWPPGRVVLRGALDFYSARILRDRALPAVLDLDRRESVVDVSGVVYLSFEGLAALIELGDRVARAGGSMRLVGLDGQPRDLVRLCGLEVELTGHGRSRTVA